MHLAIREGVLAEDDRFGLHDLERKGGNDTPGTRADKPDALEVSGDDVDLTTRGCRSCNRRRDVRRDVRRRGRRACNPLIQWWWI